MSKLYFRHGAMGSSKSMNLVATAYNYNDQDKGVIVFTSSKDSRSGLNKVKSRAGLEWNAISLTGDEKVEELRILITKQSHIIGKEIKCILVDEVQMLPARMIDVFAEVVDKTGIPIICYGLRTDYMGKLFDGSKRLFEVADSIEEVKTTCYACNKKAIMNLRVDSDLNPIYEGTQIVIGDDGYYPVCRKHYHTGIKKEV